MTFGNRSDRNSSGRSKKKKKNRLKERELDNELHLPYWERKSYKPYKMIKVL